ncbi:hypothetical protein Ahy_A07g033313 [Arachis hypogaea]|uniref:Aminotransferase-like plant mobile domain-containing protein n=1 Tax=Arachis hypogaea TaxID=3818 RepID=A0A445C948_ARAHY|nr:hypothetical protein Ahy_A07g033313 [Arachis hypogaea]
MFSKLSPSDKVKQFTVHFTWFHERFRVLPANASEDTIRIYACAYIMMLLSTQLFGDKSANRVHIRWLPFVAGLDEMGTYSWDSVALAWLYRCMCWIVWEPYATLDVLVVHPKILAEKQQVDSVLSIQRVVDPGPSIEFLDMRYRVTHRFLSSDATFADPRTEEILNDVFHRGSS